MLLIDLLDEVGEFIRYGQLANPSSLGHTFREDVVFKKVDHFERWVMVSAVQLMGQSQLSANNVSET